MLCMNTSFLCNYLSFKNKMCLSCYLRYILPSEIESFLKGIRHGLQSLPPSPKRAERKGRRRPFREAGSGHKQWNTVSCVDTFSIISKFSEQNSKI